MPDALVVGRCLELLRDDSSARMQSFGLDLTGVDVHTLGLTNDRRTALKLPGSDRYNTAAASMYPMTAGIHFLKWRVEATPPRHDICFGVVSPDHVDIAGGRAAWANPGGYIVTTRDGKCWSQRGCFDYGNGTIEPGAIVGCLVDFSERSISWFGQHACWGVAFIFDTAVTTLLPCIEVYAPGDSITFLGATTIEP
jgi:hypothetical protein